MPLCDDTHAKIEFDGQETATRQARKYVGPAMILNDAENLCAFAFIREANHCPAGRLVVHDKKQEKKLNTSFLLRLE
jgi:hypothetical protein